MLPLFPPKNESLVFSQGNFGDCYLLVGIDSFYANEETRNYFKNLFTPTDDGGVKLKLRRPNGCLVNPHIEYNYRLIPGEDNWDEIYISKAQLERFEREDSAESNCLAVIILEHLVSYYFQEYTENFDASSVAAVSGKASPSIALQGVTTIQRHEQDSGSFIFQLFGYAPHSFGGPTTRDKALYKEKVRYKEYNNFPYQVDYLACLMQINPRQNIYMDINFENTRHAYRIKSVIRKGDQWLFTVVNPWDNQKETVFSSRELIENEALFVLPEPLQKQHYLSLNAMRDIDHHYQAEFLQFIGLVGKSYQEVGRTINFETIEAIGNLFYQCAWPGQIQHQRAELLTIFLAHDRLIDGLKTILSKHSDKMPLLAEFPLDWNFYLTALRGEQSFTTQLETLKDYISRTAKVKKEGFVGQDAHKWVVSALGEHRYPNNYLLQMIAKGDFDIILYREQNPDLYIHAEQHPGLRIGLEHCSVGLQFELSKNPIDRLRVKTLIEMGVDFNFKDSQGHTLVHTMTKLDLRELFPSLLTKHVDFNVPMGDGPLFYAPNRDTVLDLISLGADPFVKNKWGRRPIDAFVRDSIFLTQFLKNTLDELAELNFRDFVSFEHYEQIRTQKVELLVQLLKEFKLNVNTQSERTKNTVTHIAALFNEPRLMDLLVRANPKPQLLLNKDKRLAIDYAQTNQVIQQLTSFNSRLEDRTNLAQSALEANSPSALLKIVGQRRIIPQQYYAVLNNPHADVQVLKAIIAKEEKNTPLVLKILEHPAVNAEIILSLLNRLPQMHSKDSILKAMLAGTSDNQTLDKIVDCILGFDPLPWTLISFAIAHEQCTPTIAIKIVNHIKLFDAPGLPNYKNYRLLIELVNACFKQDKTDIFTHWAKVLIAIISKFNCNESRLTKGIVDVIDENLTNKPNLGRLGFDWPLEKARCNNISDRYQSIRKLCNTVTAVRTDEVLTSEAKEPEVLEYLRSLKASTPDLYSKLNQVIGHRVFSPLIARDLLKKIQGFIHNSKISEIVPAHEQFLALFAKIFAQNPLANYRTVIKELGDLFEDDPALKDDIFALIKRSPAIKDPILALEIFDYYKNYQPKTPTTFIHLEFIDMINLGQTDPRAPVPPPAKQRFMKIVKGFSLHGFKPTREETDQLLGMVNTYCHEDKRGEFRAILNRLKVGKAPQQAQSAPKRTAVGDEKLVAKTPVLAPTVSSGEPLQQESSRLGTGFKNSSQISRENSPSVFREPNRKQPVASPNPVKMQLFEDFERTPVNILQNLLKNAIKDSKNVSNKEELRLQRAYDALFYKVLIHKSKRTESKNHENAYNVTLRIYNSLGRAPDLDSFTNAFRLNVNEQSKEILNTHRGGVGQVLLDLINGLLALITLKPCWSSQWRFFNPNTETMNVVDQFEKNKEDYVNQLKNI